MAFTFANFAAQSGQSSKRIAPAVFSYKSADAVTAVAASGYFDEVANMLLPGDLILVAVVSGETATACGMLAVAAVSDDGVVTTVQMAAGGEADLSSYAKADLSNVTGTLSVAHGGTGSTEASAARTALGLGSIATSNSPLPVANGGTGAAGAKTNLGIS